MTSPSVLSNPVLPHPDLKLLFRIFNLLLPLALFALVMLWVRDFFSAGDARTGLFIMLGALVVLAVWLGLLLRYCYLPLWGRLLGERVYMNSYSPEDDPLVAMAARIRREHSRDLLPQFEQLVQQEGSRARGWSEFADLLADEFHDPAAALAVWRRGAEKVSRGEDKAMCLYRAARLCEKRLKDAARASELYAEAANKYPSTAYGKLARQRLSEVI